MLWRDAFSALPEPAAAAWLLLSLCLGSLACGPDPAARLAGRILDDHRKTTGVRPLPEAGSIRVRLSPAGPAGGERGSALIEWEGERYRETIESAGVTTVRGIQSGKAFLTDEDGVTRVGSEPMLAELVTRSYFWRRGYLFDDRERAKISLGPADDATVSVVLTPRGGNPLRLVFDRRRSTLRGVLSPLFRLDFQGAAKFRDASRSDRAAVGEIIFAGLPTRRLPDPTVGGWHGNFSQPFAEAAFAASGGGLSIPAEVSGAPARLSIDADADGPLRVSPDLARRAGLAPRHDVFGREIAEGVTLGVGPLTMPSLHAEIAGAGAAGVDAVAGGTLFRETVVEIDPAATRVRLHDPARWAPPEGFTRVVIDDDGDRPTAILTRSGRRLRLRLGARTAAPLLLPPEVWRALGLDVKATVVRGLFWGPLRLPPVPVRLETGGFQPAWGDDGAIGLPLLLRFHVFVDMPHRWVYVKPVDRW